ncbi:hypothetical protein RMSM_07740 [Rhodopirellula maiorica SM1]|uniref:Uncharacterized protein n=1 Tax=Rhodopirellula maiorica SM1 TaxID=1265738 RepID=M5RIZ8_9BACT|nr:hypothetical protein RMSM_07740 [Rhodopirellula maiorica SM1]
MGKKFASQLAQAKTGGPRGAATTRKADTTVKLQWLSACSA